MRWEMSPGEGPSVRGAGPGELGGLPPLEEILEVLSTQLGDTLRGVALFDDLAPVDAEEDPFRGLPRPLSLAVVLDRPDPRLRDLEQRFNRHLPVPVLELFGLWDGPDVGVGPHPPRTWVRLHLRRSGRGLMGDAAVFEPLLGADGADGAVGVEEALVLMRRRTGYLIQGLAEGDLATPTDPSDRILAQAVVGLVTAASALAIEAGQYRADLEEREERFVRVYGGYPMVAAVARAAMRMAREGLDLETDPARFWLWARRVFLVTLFRLTCRVARVPYLDWWDVSRDLDPGFGDRLRRWILGWTDPDRRRNLDLAQRREWFDLARIHLLLSKDRRRGHHRAHLAAAQEAVFRVTGQECPRDFDAMNRILGAL